MYKRSSALLRITRHNLDEERMVYIKSVFGDDVVIHTEDIAYGNDPVAAVKKLIEVTEESIAGVDRVVAIEAQAPFHILSTLVDAQRELRVIFIRAQFVRDEAGRAIVVGQDESGRDLLKFSHYEQLVRIAFETRRLLSSPNWS